MWRWPKEKKKKKKWILMEWIQSQCYFQVTGMTTMWVGWKPDRTLAGETDASAAAGCWTKGKHQHCEEQLCLQPCAAGCTEISPAVQMHFSPATAPWFSTLTAGILVSLNALAGRIGFDFMTKIFTVLSKAWLSFVLLGRSTYPSGG